MDSIADKSKALLLATYNGEKYIREQLDSLFKQTVADFVIYVHDDGSTDKTVSIVDEYRELYPGRIEFLDGAPTGNAKNNFLWMMSQVESDIYFLCDQDDVWLPEKMETTIEALETVGDDIACVFTDMYVVDKDLNMMSDSFIRYIGRSPENIAYTQILIDNPAAGCTMCFTRALRDLVLSCSQIDLDNVPMHDVLILELAAVCGEVRAVDEPLVYYRQTGNNTMGASTEDAEDKVKRNVAEATGGGFLQRKKAFIMEARNFAGEILKYEKLPEDKRQMLADFVAIGSQSKLNRMKFYRKNNFSRANHSFWMRMWV